MKELGDVNVSTLLSLAQSSDESRLWPANKLEMEIRDTIAQLRAVELSAPGGVCTDDMAAQAEMVRLGHHVDHLEGRLPNPARTVSQIISRAEIAWLWADKDVDGRLAVLIPNKAGTLMGDCADIAAARLVVDVLQFAGLSRHYGLDGMAAAPTVDHWPVLQDWRRMEQENAALWAKTDTETQPEEVLEHLDDEITQLASDLMARPVTSWEDIAVLGALGMYWLYPQSEEGNLRDDMQPSKEGYDTQAIAHLLNGIARLTGGRHV